MKKDEQHIQSEGIRNATILLNRDDIRITDMNELYEIVEEEIKFEKFNGE